MRQRPDPFTEQLEADLSDGVAAADRGESLSEVEIWQRFGLKEKDEPGDTPG